MQDLVLDDVYGVWFTSFWHTLPGYGILAILGSILFVGGYLGFKAVQKYRKGTSKDVALRRLKELLNKVEVKKIELRPVYQELTDITKSYAQWRYGLPRGMTDYELLTWLDSTNCGESHKNEVERVVIDVQAVKFGPVEPSKKQVLKDIAAIMEFITAAGERVDIRNEK